MSLDDSYNGCVVISVKRCSLVNRPEQLWTGVYTLKTLEGGGERGGGRGEGRGRLAGCHNAT